MIEVISMGVDTDGRTTQARVRMRLLNGDQIIRQASATCHPDDRFDPQIGEDIALARAYIMAIQEIERRAIERVQSKLVVIGRAMHDARKGERLQVQVNANSFMALSVRVAEDVKMKELVGIDTTTGLVRRMSEPKPTKADSELVKLAADLAADITETVRQGRRIGAFL